MNCHIWINFDETYCDQLAKDSQKNFFSKKFAKLMFTILSHKRLLILFKNLSFCFEKWVIMLKLFGHLVNVNYAHS